MPLPKKKTILRASLANVFSVYSRVPSANYCNNVVLVDKIIIKPIPTARASAYYKHPFTIK